MKITPEENELLLALAAEFANTQYDEKRHVLVKDAARLWGSTRATTFRLDKLVDDGGEKETVIHQGRMKNGYLKKDVSTTCIITFITINKRITYPDDESSRANGKLTVCRCDVV